MSSSLITNGLLSIASGTALGWSLFVALSDVKKDGNVLEHANVLNPQEYSMLSSTFFVFMVMIGARLSVHLVALLQRLLGSNPGAEESRMWFLIRHLSSLGSLISIGIVNGILRTPSAIHPCPLSNATEVCDISEQKYDDDVQDSWFLLTLVAGLIAVVLKLSDLLIDFRFNLSELIEDNRKGDNKTWGYLLLVFLGIVLSTVNLIISDIHDVKESDKYKDDSFLDWAVFLTMVALIAHSGLLLVTILARGISQGLGDRFCRFRLGNMFTYALTGTMAIVSIVFIVLYVTMPNRVYIPIFILSGILAVVFLLHVLFRPNEVVGIDFIAANEIPLLRMLVVLSTLSMLSLINGILVAYQIDMTFASTSLALMALSDILGRNEF